MRSRKQASMKIPLSAIPAFMVMQTFSFNIYHTCRISKHLAIRWLVPGVPLEFQSDRVINQYHPNS